MSRRQTHDVAVVGAGMVGAALALKLAQAGFDVAVIEPRAPACWRAQDDVDLRVVALASSSVDLLDGIGVWQSIRAARACAYRRMHVWDALAPGELTFDSADDGAAALGYIVENRLIQHTLWQALQASAAITLHCPAGVATTEVGTDRRVLVLADGTRVGASLVVAADGGESAMRNLVGIATRDHNYAQRAIVAHVTTARPHEATAWQRFLPGATLAFLPLDDGRPLSAMPGLQGPSRPSMAFGTLGLLPVALGLLVGALPSSGRRRNPRRRGCWRSTMPGSAPSLAWRSISGSARSRRRPRARHFLCA